jgi:phosphatidylglycerophosphate synthase
MSRKIPAREVYEMSKRVSHSLLDPFFSPPVKRLYGALSIPSTFPPEGIVLIGHLLAITAAVGFAYSADAWWGGLLVVLGVAGNHIADILDGTHARATRQCRNGGELLDHFTDPLSFSYWLAGLAISCGRIELGLVAVVCLYATALLTNIKAKMIGEFTLARFGPTEFKALLVLYGVGLSLLTAGFFSPASPQTAATCFLIGLIAVGIVQLIVNLVLAVREVNAYGLAPDVSEWETSRPPSREQSALPRQAVLTNRRTLP